MSKELIQAAKNYMRTWHDSPDEDAAANARMELFDEVAKLTEQGKCQDCGGIGIVPIDVISPTCCMNPTETGECCNNLIPDRTQEPVACPTCQPAQDAEELSFVEFIRHETGQEAVAKAVREIAEDFRRMYDTPQDHQSFKLAVYHYFNGFKDLTKEQ